MGDKMSDKKEEKNVIATTRQFERIKIIHEHIKNMEYPNVPRLVEIINARANTKEEETSIPTINRDIGLMKEQYKAPIKYDRINNGYFYETDYNLPLLNTVSSDQMTILSSAKTLLSHYEGTPLYNEALALLDKLSSGSFQKNNSLLNRIALTPTPKININPVIWDKITQALRDNSVIKFDYNGRWRTKTTYRVVHPYQLLLDDGVCFLWGYDEAAEDKPDKLRLFNLNRMKTVCVTPRHFELPEDFEFENKCGGGKFGAFHNNSTTCEQYKIEFYGIARAYVHSCIWADDQILEDDEENDITTLSFSANQFNHVLGWILEQGANAKPIEPPRLVKEWKQEIMNMMNLLDD